MKWNVPNVQTYACHSWVWGLAIYSAIYSFIRSSFHSLICRSFICSCELLPRFPPKVSKIVVYNNYWSSQLSSLYLSSFTLVTWRRGTTRTSSGSWTASSSPRGTGTTTCGGATTVRTTTTAPGGCRTAGGIPTGAGATAGAAWCTGMWTLRRWWSRSGPWGTSRQPPRGQGLLMWSSRRRRRGEGDENPRRDRHHYKRWRARVRGTNRPYPFGAQLPPYNAEIFA